ncbi:MAG: hypothetical protein GVY23_06715 [Spirochaetes bacterium]|jgi:hypothetical protein|nr:hypothetical protein [Spirochaetota bacterium]
MFMPPTVATEGSIARTNFWSVDLAVESGIRTRGIWQISYTVERPDRQLEEVPVYWPFPANDTGGPKSRSMLGGLIEVEQTSAGETYNYWMIHSHTVRWTNPEGRIFVSLTNTSDKTADVSGMKIEIASVPGVELVSRDARRMIGPGKTVQLELVRVYFSDVPQDLDGAMTVPFRFVDMPIALNSDGSIREISLFEDSFELTREPSTYTSEISLTPVHTSKAFLRGADGSPLHRSDISYGEYHTTEYFDPIDLHFRIEIEGEPLVPNEPLHWATPADASQVYDYGTLQRVFPDGAPTTVAVLETS